MRTTIKRVLAICAAIIISVVLAVNCFFGNAFSESDSKYENTCEDIMELQEGAVLLSDDLDRHFGCDEDGGIEYPSDYAGRWLDGSKLVLALTSIDSESTRKYIEWAGDKSDLLVFKKAEYSHKLLSEKMDDIMEYLRIDGFNVTMGYISDVGNKIVIGIETSKGKTIKELGAELSDIFSVPVSVSISEEAEPL